MKLWWLQCSWCLSTVNTCRIDLRALLRHHCPALNYALCTRSHQRSWDRGLLISSQPESYEESKWLQHISDSCTLRRALRETHAIQPMHTLTRHTTCAAIWQWKGRNQMRPGEISKSSGILIKPQYMFTFNLRCVPLGLSQTSWATPSHTQFCSLCIGGSE